MLIKAVQEIAEEKTLDVDASVQAESNGHEGSNLPSSTPTGKLTL